MNKDRERIVLSEREDPDTSVFRVSYRDYGEAMHRDFWYAMPALSVHPPVPKAISFLSRASENSMYRAGGETIAAVILPAGYVESRVAKLKSFSRDIAYRIACHYVSKTREAFGGDAVVVEDRTSVEPFTMADLASEVTKQVGSIERIRFLTLSN